MSYLQNVIEDNIRMDLREIEWEVVAQMHLVNTVMNLRVP
jgi:hypothetical protein